MNPVIRIAISALAFAAGIAVGAAAPASAATDCGSNANIGHVHRRLDGAIDQLSHDRHDYGGHRVNAMNDLQSARNELAAAERYAIGVAHDDAACFRARGATDGNDSRWGMRGQRGSNGNIVGVDRWVGVMIAQLNRDEHDYGGHRVNAIRDLQAARGELAQASR